MLEFGLNICERIKGNGVLHIGRVDDANIIYSLFRDEVEGGVYQVPVRVHDAEAVVMSNILAYQKFQEF